MKLSVSNLGWLPQEDAEVSTVLCERGIRGIELVPTRAWKIPQTASRDEARAYRARWGDLGISIVAFQSLLYGRPDLVLFGAESAREEMLAHLAALFQRAEWLGATALVFGSPGNRRRGALSDVAAADVAVPFFRRVGAVAANHGVVLCIEPNPVSLGCDFVTTPSEAIALVQAIDHTGVRVQFDTGAQAATGEGPLVALAGGAALIGHAHASEPGLGVLSALADHKAAAEALRVSGYKGWISVEMLAAESGNPKRVGRALDVAIAAYA